MNAMTRQHIVRAFVRAAAGAALVAASATASASVTSPVIGKLLWSEEFNGASLDGSVWAASNGNGCQIGLCGYGNQELQFYSPNNLSIVNVPFEPATRALAITARREVVGSNQFTSGKVDTAGKVQVKYGLVEVRMATPKVGVGLWPAAWMLGTSPQSWPRKGEIDLMEMGGRQPAGLPPISPDPTSSSSTPTPASPATRAAPPPPPGRPRTGTRPAGRSPTASSPTASTGRTRRSASRCWTTVASTTCTRRRSPSPRRR
jgi:hypothetical protein